MIKYKGKNVRVHGFGTSAYIQDDIHIMELFVFKFGERLLTHNCARIFSFSKTLPNVFHTNDQQNYNKFGTFIYNKKNKKQIIDNLNNGTRKGGQLINNDVGGFEEYEEDQVRRLSLRNPSLSHTHTHTRTHTNSLRFSSANSHPKVKVERAHFCTDQSLNLDPDFITASLRREKVHMV